jgi:glutathione S-transferase
MPEYQLYCFDKSGNSYKAALMLALTRSDWEPVWVDYFNGETRAEGWKASLNEMGEVPLLVHRGEQFSQSGVILDYLAEVTQKFGAKDARERREIWRWILFDNHKFTSYTATLRFLRSIAKTGETPVTDFLHKRATAAWSIVDRHLADRAFVLGDRPTIADISLAGYVFYDGEIGIEPKDYPSLAAWRDRMRALPGWAHPYVLMPSAPMAIA